MRRNTSIAFLFLFFVSSHLFALPLSDMLSLAKEKSDVYKSTLSSARITDFSALIATYDKQHTFSFGIKNGSWNKKYNAPQDESILFTPSFDYTSASDNTTSVSLSSPINIALKSPETNSTYKPSLSVSQTVLLDAVKNSESDLIKQKGLMSAAAALGKADKNFENTFYLSLVNVLTSQNDYLLAKNKYSIAENDFFAEVNSKNIKEGTYSYKEKQNNLITLLNDSELKKTLYENALRDFKRVAGFDYEEVDEIEFPNISFTLKEEGNSTVQLSFIDKLIAKNKFDVLTKNDDRVLGVDLLANTVVKGKNVDSYGVKGTVSYKDTSLKLSASAMGDFNKSNLWAFEPTVNFSLEYSLGSDTDETKRLNIQKAALEMQNKSFDYDNALLTYKTSAITMLSDIAIQNANYGKIKNNYENAKLSFQKSSSLNENGYYTPLTFETEEILYKNAKNDYNVFMLKSLILHNNAEILNI